VSPPGFPVISIADTHVLAIKKQQRLAVVRSVPLDLTNNDVVVAAVMDLVRATLEARDGAG